LKRKTIVTGFNANLANRNPRSPAARPDSRREAQLLPIRFKYGWLSYGWPRFTLLRRLSPYAKTGLLICYTGSASLSFLLHDHQNSVFARREPPGMEGRGRVGRKIAVQRSKEFPGFRFFLA
jgi:hypothetical protein